jgi:hypothetical protein
MENIRTASTRSSVYKLISGRFADGPIFFRTRWIGVLVVVATGFLFRPAVADVIDAEQATTPSSGPCAQGGVASITDRPGIGRAATLNGSPCVVPAGRVVLEAGYRAQFTSGGGTSTLATYPSPVLRIGTAGRNEIVISPSLLYSNRTGAAIGGTFTPAFGQQDAGLGLKHNIRDRPWLQDALGVFATLPTGYPNGPSGFSAGVATYTVGYSASVSVNARIGLTTTQNVTLGIGMNPTGTLQRYVSYQPSFGVAYALSSSTSLLLQDQLILPTAPGGGSGNRAAAAIQRTLGRNVVLDVEFEQNFLPQPPLKQHSLGAGLTIML